METLLLVFVAIVGLVSSIDSGFLIAEEYEQLQPKVGGKPKQFYNREGTDAYTYGYTNSESFKTERKLDGVVNGIYGSLDPRGFVRKVQYIADDRGYRIVSSVVRKPTLEDPVPKKQEQDDVTSAPGIVPMPPPPTTMPPPTTTTMPPTTTTMPPPTTTMPPTTTTIPPITTTIPPITATIIIETTPVDTEGPTTKIDTTTPPPEEISVPQEFEIDLRNFR